MKMFTRKQQCIIDYVALAAACILTASVVSCATARAEPALNVPPPPTIVSVMYGYERHCPINRTLTSMLINREIMLIPAKAEAQRAMAIANGDAMAQRSDFCTEAEAIFTIAIQSGQYLDEKLRGAIRCANIRYLPDAEAMQCFRYGPGGSERR